MPIQLTWQDILEREKRRKEAYEKFKADKREATREKLKPLIVFTKEYLKTHYYLNSVRLAKEYSDYNHTHSLTHSFGIIIRDLVDLGAIEKYTPKQYRKVINPDNIEALRNGNK